MHLYTRWNEETSLGRGQTEVQPLIKFGIFLTSDRGIKRSHSGSSDSTLRNFASEDLHIQDQ